MLNFSILNQIHEAIEGSQDNLLLFGSVARGDASQASDIDVLQLLPRRKSSFKKGNVNISVYDANTLLSMAREGSLFILHLKLDGEIIKDAKGQIQTILDTYQTPKSYLPLRGSLRRVLSLLDISEDFYFSHWKQCNDLILYITRTELYIEFAEAGNPKFSLVDICSIKNDASLNKIANLKFQTVPDWDDFVICLQYLEKHLAATAFNPFGSIDALLVANSTKDPVLTALGLRLLSKKNASLGYDLLSSNAKDDAD